MVNKLIVSVFIVGIYSMSAVGFAQTNSLLDGTWHLDSVSVIKNSNHSSVEVNQFKQNPFFAIFDELTFQGDDLTIIQNRYKIRGIVQIANNKISIPFLSAPVEADYQIKGEELFLTQRIHYPGENNPNDDVYIVLTKYKKQ